MTERTPRRGVLTRERILDAALGLVDARGIEGLSMRRLGVALGVDPMAVYHHIGGKQGIAIALVERVFAGFSVPGSGRGWEDDVRAWAQAYRRLAIAHPGLALTIVSDPAAVAIASAHVSDPLLTALRAAELPRNKTDAAVAALVDYVHGAVLPVAASAAARSAGEVAAAQPVESGAARVERPGDPAAFRRRLDRDFERGLDVIVAGIRAMTPSREGGES